MGTYQKMPVIDAIRQASEATFTNSGKRGGLNPAGIEKLKRASEVVLALIGIAGIATVAVLAPNALQVLKKIPWKSLTKKRINNQDRLAKSLYYLKQQGYVAMEVTGGDYALKLTKEGQERMRILQLEMAHIPRARSWDGRWWLLLADIPSRFRSKADVFRRKVKDMGMFPLQRTVWVYPFNPRNEIEFISLYYGLTPFTTTVEACSLEPGDEKLLHEHFHKAGLI